MSNNKFRSRILVDPLDVLAVVNHLEDNRKPLRVVLTIKPRRAGKTDCSSIKKTKVKKIKIKNRKQISEINNFLNENLFMADIRVKIE